MTKGIISLGEALIDFIPLDDHNESFKKSPGGAPANVAVGVSRLGAVSTFLGKVGDDVLGRFMKETLDGFGVDTTHMSLTKDTRTGVVFVTLGEGGERSFEFYIDPSADRFLTEAEAEQVDYAKHNVIHFGSISMISEPAKSATKRAVTLAKEHGLIISYDPNLRLGLWPSEEEARATIKSMLDQADVVKLSEEELTFLTGEEDVEAGIDALAPYQIPMVIVTLGADGSWIFMQDQEPVRADAMKVKAVDTTGAGDAFVSGILYQLSEQNKPVKAYSREEALNMAAFASVSGGLAASTKGAMAALPTLDQVNETIRTNQS